MKVFFLLPFFVLYFFSAFAQQAGKISGTAMQNAKPAEGATVSLLRAKDSVTIKLSVASKEGAYTFENIAEGKYLISVTAVGHQKAFSKVFEVTPSSQNIRVAQLRLTEDAKALTNVTVTAKRPLIENKIDRTVVNVDASITNVGTSALEVLEKSPGVSVDAEGNISLKGKEGVLVMVDGRPTQLSGADLAALLRNMNSNQLDQIEIMTNPPARYDAAGTSGLINIKTKKIITAGYNGSATLTYSQGRYPKTAEAFNFNYRNSKLNLFTNVSHNYRQAYSLLTIQRNLYNATTNALENYFDQRADLRNEGNSYNAKVGVDFFATKNTTLGLVLNGTSSATASPNLNTTRISSATKALQSITSASVDNTSDWKNFSTNLNFRTVLAKGKELTSDLDFLTYRGGTDQFMVNAFRDATGSPFRKADTLMGNLPQNIDVYSGKIDYFHPLKKDSRFEAGLKSSIVRTDNNAVYDSIQFGDIIHDFNRSNHFVYEENINAAYANLSTPLSKKWSAQFGLRLENTNAKGTQLTTGETFDRHYTQLFPTAYFQYKLNDNNSFGANFGRRVRRPNYESLNPFIRFVDRYTYTKGNPMLKPSLSNNIELSHTWRNQITTTINYTATTDIIDDIIDQKGEEAYKAPANIASLHQYGIAVNANTNVTKWWTSSISVNAFNNRYKGVADGAPINVSQTTVTVMGTQQFKLTKTLTGELNGRFRSGYLDGIMKTKAMGFIGAGLSQQVMKGAGVVRLTVRDIFNTLRFSAESRYGNVDFNFQQKSESQVVSIGFSYRFSKGKKMAPVKRTTGSADEEQNRIGQ